MKHRNYLCFTYIHIPLQTKDNILRYAGVSLGI